MLSSVLVGCVNDTNSQDETTSNPKVIIKMLDKKTIKIELLPEYAPKTVENFLKLVDEHYYDNTIFHRIIHNFMVQAGEFEVSDDNKVITKDERENIIGEFSRNGFTQNTLEHTVGVISMARVSPEVETEATLNSASTQFFICTNDAPNLNGVHAAFGRVLDEESLENVIDISLIPTGNYYSRQDFPINDRFSDDIIAVGAVIASIERLE